MLKKTIPVPTPYTQGWALKAYGLLGASHGIDHADRTLTNAAFLLEEEIKSGRLDKPSEEDTEILFMATYLHDVRDYKYKDKRVTREEFDFKLRVMLDGALVRKNVMVFDILHITENMSWSQEQRGDCVPLKELDRDWIRLIAEDADWLDALGPIGLQRCLQYTEETGGKLPEDAIGYITTKLLMIPNTLNTVTAREMVKRNPNHYIQPLLDYIAQHTRNLKPIT